jgi:5-methyltetrahydrofolate--homocysteine methyltransferase
MADLKALATAISEGDLTATVKLVEEGLADGTGAEVLLNDGLIAGMEIVNWQFKNDIIYVPDVLIAGRAMKEGMEILEPEFLGTNAKPVGKFLIGTVEGDLHDIGKNIVVIMLKGKGFEVVDLGVDVPPEMFVERAKKEEENLRWIGLSALLTTTMSNMEKILGALRDGGITTRVMVGGAPVTEDYATKIGANYAPDASLAANIAVELLDSGRSGCIEVRKGEVNE